MPSTMKGFYDFCIDITNNKDDVKIRQLLTKLYENGYRIIAINQTIDEKILDTEKKRKINSETECSLNKIIEAYNDIKQKNNFDNRLVILNRLTFIYSDPAKIYSLNQLESFIKKFHLLAVIPKGNNALQFACTNSIADIITINSLCTGYKMSRKMYSQAVEKGIFFEIQYIDLISPANRKAMMHTAHLLYIYGKSKNVIISSGARDNTLIRNPYDIINLAHILGLNQVQAKACILEQCKHLLVKAEGRRYGKAIFTVTSTSFENTNLITDSNTDDDC